MEARDLDEAIGIVNATGYGLTSGLESLDDREQERWLEKTRAGNLYINRPTTGAIVLRQPFGGWAKQRRAGIKAARFASLMRFMAMRESSSRDSPPEKMVGLVKPDPPYSYRRSRRIVVAQVLPPPRVGAIDS
jgi:RHH-type proline utilization regulon transcriptional repressor/proline dehydrogenase/delta 1-pyrroline-5-carboxylate dehydrogenase